MILLLIVLTVLLWLIYLTMGKDFMNPAFLFCTSFVYSAVWATAYTDVWELNLHFNTFWVIFGGVLIYTCSTYVIRMIYKGSHHKKIWTLQTIEIKNWKLILLIVLEAIGCFATIYIIIRSGVGSTLSIAINAFRRSRLFSDEAIITFPRWLGYIRNIATACGYLFPFILANNLFSEKKITLNHILLIAVLVLSVVSSSLFGGRQQFINVILAFLGSYLIIKKKKDGVGKQLSFKTMLIVFGGGTGALWAFKNASGLIGKDLESISLLDYLAKYSGAQIKNLDLFLQSNYAVGKTDIWGFQTFRNMLIWLGFDLPARDLPFRIVNGFELGNVYTTFYDYIYDFGYIGMIACVVFMAAVQTYIYMKVDNMGSSTKNLLWCTMYSFQIPNILLSFFSNEFYIYTFDKGFLIYFLSWVLIYIYCFKIDLVLKKGKMEVILHKKNILRNYQTKY